MSTSPASTRPANVLMAVTYAVGALGIGIAFSTLGDDPPSLTWAALLAVGAGGILSFVRHALFHRADAERMGWTWEVLEHQASDLGGIKEFTALISGEGVYARLKYESGVHRVQRVPTTEAGGRIHTSAATVAVLPEAEDVDIDLPASDIRIDTMRSSGAGGQHVNTTDSAVRITHLPTGMIVTSSEKSQHQNRANAMAVLRARLYELERERISSERSADRKAQIGSGDRSERIRTYNFPQGRMTDHRINLTLYSLGQILEGNLTEVIDALTAHDHATRLADAE